MWDNEGGIGRRVNGRVRLTGGVEALRGSLGVSVFLARPRDPETKGIVERNNGYLETSFLPGRSFTSPADFNTQLASWLVKANARHHRRIECRPIDRLGADKAAMVSIPPIAPTLGRRTAVRLPRDHYVRLDSCDYSVDPAAIGRLVHVEADLEHVTVRHDGAVVARHPRCWAPHQTITAPEHAERAAQLRRAHLRPLTRPGEAENVEVRDLSHYDELFGLHEAA